MFLFAEENVNTTLFSRDDPRMRVLWAAHLCRVRHTREPTLYGIMFASVLLMNLAFAIDVYRIARDSSTHPID